MEGGIPIGTEDSRKLGFSTAEAYCVFLLLYFCCYCCCLFQSICYYCGKDSSCSYLSKAHLVPDPLLSGSSNVPVTRRPEIVKNVLYSHWFLTEQLHTDHVPLLFRGVNLKYEKYT